MKVGKLVHFLPQWQGVLGKLKTQNRYGNVGQMMRYRQMAVIFIKCHEIPLMSLLGFSSCSLILQ